MHPIEKYIQLFSGATGQYLTNNHFIFFSPNNSAKDFSLRALSIVTAPIIFTSLALSFVIELGYQLFKTFTYLFMQDYSATKESLEETCLCFISIVIALLSTCLSSFVNLMDLIGSVLSPAPLENVLYYQYEENSNLDNNDESYFY